MPRFPIPHLNHSTTNSSRSLRCSVTVDCATALRSSVSTGDEGVGSSSLVAFWVHAYTTRRTRMYSANTVVHRNDRREEMPILHWSASTCHGVSSVSGGSGDMSGQAGAPSSAGKGEGGSPPDPPEKWSQCRYLIKSQHPSTRGAWTVAAYEVRIMCGKAGLRASTLCSERCLWHKRSSCSRGWPVSVTST